MSAWFWQTLQFFDGLSPQGELALLIGSFLLFQIVLYLIRWPHRGIALDRKAIVTDLLYYGLYRVVLPPVYAVGYMLFGKEVNSWFEVTPLRSMVISQPLWMQVVETLYVSDLLSYWVHRAMHRVGVLWDFHAVHHSSTHLNWLSNIRRHPALQVALLPVYMVPPLLGFHPAALAIALLVQNYYFYIEHSNLRWNFGPLRFVFVSPIFHRWHHSKDPAVQGKNLSFIFSFNDLLFGTFHDARGAISSEHGLDDAEYPEGFFGQLVVPFVKLYRRFRPPRLPVADG